MSILDPGADACWIQFLHDHRDHGAGDVVAYDERSAMSYFRDKIARPAPCSAIDRMYRREAAKAGVDTHLKIMKAVRAEFSIEAECSDSAERMKTAADMAKLLGVPLDDLL